MKGESTSSEKEDRYCSNCSRIVWFNDHREYPVLIGCRVTIIFR